MSLSVRVLGPIELEWDGLPVSLGPRLCLLVGGFITARGAVVPTDRLIRLVWGDSAPPTAATTLRSHIRRLRRALGSGSDPTADRPDVLIRAGSAAGAGYALRIDPDEVDACRFGSMVDGGRQLMACGDFRVAADHLTKALELWRGRPYADVGDHPFFMSEVGRLGSLFRTARVAQATALLQAGDADRAIGHLEELVVEDPFDEEITGLLATALYRTGRAEEAARMCRRGLTGLHGRGIDSPGLQTLLRDILNRAVAPNPPPVAGMMSVPAPLRHASVDNCSLHRLQRELDAALEHLQSALALYRDLEL